MNNKGAYGQEDTDYEAQQKERAIESERKGQEMVRERDRKEREAEKNPPKGAYSDNKSNNEEP